MTQVTFQDYTCRCGSGCVRCVVGFDQPHIRVLPGTPEFEAWKNCNCYAGCNQCRALKPTRSTDGISRWWRHTWDKWVKEGRWATDRRHASNPEKDIKETTEPNDQDIDEFYTGCACHELTTNCKRIAALHDEENYKSISRQELMERPEYVPCDCSACKAADQDYHEELYP